MTGRELIAELEQHDMELEVYIEDMVDGELKLYDIVEKEIDESIYYEGKFVGYEKVKIVVLRK